MHWLLQRQSKIENKLIRPSAGCPFDHGNRRIVVATRPAGASACGPRRAAWPDARKEESFRCSADQEAPRLRRQAGQVHSHPAVSLGGT